MDEAFSDIKRRLRRELWPDRLNEKLWRDLATTPPHYVLRVQRGTVSFDDFVVLYRQKAAIHEPTKWNKAKEGEGDPDARLEALGMVAAIEAPLVVQGLSEWRKRLFGDEVLDARDIPDWLRAQVEREGEPAEEYVLYPFTTAEQALHGHSLTGALWTGDREGVARWLRAEAERIEKGPQGELPSTVREPPLDISCAAPGGRILRVAIRRDGELAQLKAIARKLELFFKWPEHLGVAFVLTDVAPPAVPWKLLYADAALPALRRLTLELDPRLSGAEVASLYNEARAGLRRGRNRPMSEKHLTLAVFAARWREGGRSWREARAEWNRQIPEHAYKTEGDATARRFGLDCRTAWSRLTGQPWPGPPPKRDARWREITMAGIDELLRAFRRQLDAERKEEED